MEFAIINKIFFIGEHLSSCENKPGERMQKVFQKMLSRTAVFLLIWWGGEGRLDRMENSG